MFSCDQNHATKPWIHLSFGEHICRPCISVFENPRAFEEPCLTDGTIYMERYTLWREMMHSCQPVIKSVVNYIGNNLLPWWIRCQKCRKWRQIFRKIQMLPDITEGFTCSKSIKCPIDPCSLPEDERVRMVLSSPQSFFASLKVQPLLHSSPLGSLSPPYPPDALGVVPGYGGHHEGFPNFPEFCRPFSRPDEVPAPPGSWSPIDISPWERNRFPHMTRHPSMYLALRNSILFLWNMDTSTLLSTDRVAKALLVRGLSQILLVEQWIPNLLTEFTRMGIVNTGVCNQSSEQKAQVIAQDHSRHIAVIGPPLSSFDLRTAVFYNHVKNFFTVQHKSSAVVCELLVPPNTSVPTSPVFREPKCQVLRALETASFVSHSWANQVVGAVNNCVVQLAKQANLSFEVEPTVVIFQKASSSEVQQKQHQQRVIQVSNALAARMEFHVEGIFERLFFTSKRNHITANTAQDAFDAVDQELYPQFADLHNTELERLLIEYFLSRIEERLTQDVILSSFLNPAACPSCPAPPIISFTCLTPSQVSGLLLGDNSSPQSAPDAPKLEQPESNAFNEACSVLQVTYGNPTVVFPVQNAHQRFVRHLTRHLPPAPSVVAALAVSLASCGGAGGLFITRGDTPEPRPVDSVVISLPPSCLRIVFCDDPLEGLRRDNSRSDHEDASHRRLQIYLPHQLRLPNLSKSSATKYPTRKAEAGDENELVPCWGLTVTLVYAEPWWRSILSAAMNPEDDGGSGSGSSLMRIKLEEGAINGSTVVTAGPRAPPMLFALLPDGREDRGFATTFRDVSVETSSSTTMMGVLQTQILGSSARDFWHESDTSIANLVHSRLLDCLLSPPCSASVHGGDVVPPMSSPLSASFVARFPPPSHTASTATTEAAEVVVDKDDTNVFQLSPGWWRMLAQAASIHVLQCLDDDENPSSSSSYKAPENRVDPMDVLTTEVFTGLDWSANYCLGAVAAKWSASRCLTFLRRAAETPDSFTCVSSETEDDDDGSQPTVVGASGSSSAEEGDDESATSPERSPASSARSWRYRKRRRSRR